MKILIVEDEHVIAQRIERLTREIFADSRYVQFHAVTTIEEARSYLLVHQIDLLFLDLNVKGSDGFLLLDEPAAGSFYTIIISAYSDQAIRAFGYPVVDFIEKPFSRQRLEQAFDKLNHLAEKNDFTSQYLSIKKGGEIKLIEIDQILYLKGAGVYSEIVQQQGPKELHQTNLEKINTLLPSSFVRIHKSYIVNFHFVKKLITHGGSKYSVLLKTNEELPVSRTRYAEIKDMLKV